MGSLKPEKEIQQWDRVVSTNGISMAILCQASKGHNILEVKHESEADGQHN